MPLSIEKTKNYNKDQLIKRFNETVVKIYQNPMSNHVLFKVYYKLLNLKQKKSNNTKNIMAYLAGYESQDKSSQIILLSLTLDYSSEEELSKITTITNNYPGIFLFYTNQYSRSILEAIPLKPFISNFQNNTLALIETAQLINENNRNLTLINFNEKPILNDLLSTVSKQVPNPTPKFFIQNLSIILNATEKEIIKKNESRYKSTPCNLSTIKK